MVKPQARNTLIKIPSLFHRTSIRSVYRENAKGMCSPAEARCPVREFNDGLDTSDDAPDRLRNYVEFNVVRGIEHALLETTSEWNTKEGVGQQQKCARGFGPWQFAGYFIL